MTTPARSALAVALGGMVLVRAASAQPAVPPPAPPPPDANAPEVQYDTYIEPFDDDPVLRLHNIVPLPPPTPLFAEYDPLVGLDQHAKTSRVALTTRAIFSLPVMTVKAGDTFDVPFIQYSGPPITAHTLKFEYDPKVVQAIGARNADWANATVNDNPTPEHITPESKFIVLQWGSEPWLKKGRLLTVKMRAVAPGDSALQIYYYDVADDTFNLAPALVRDGLVHVIP